MPPSEQTVQVQCQRFVETLQTPAFVIIGWRKDNGEVDVVQCVKDMSVAEYFKGMTWATNEVAKEI